MLLVEDIDGSVMEPEKERSPPQPRFASSKWETVDEAELEAQGNVYWRRHYMYLSQNMQRLIRKFMEVFTIVEYMYILFIIYILFIWSAYCFFQFNFKYALSNWLTAYWINCINYCISVAMTTSKWDLLDQQDEEREDTQSSKIEESEDIDGAWVVLKLLVVNVNQHTEPLAVFSFNHNDFYPQTFRRWRGLLWQWWRFQ